MACRAIITHWPAEIIAKQCRFDAEITLILCRSALNRMRNAHGIAPKRLANANNSIKRAESILHDCHLFISYNCVPNFLTKQSLL